MLIFIKQLLHNPKVSISVLALVLLGLIPVFYLEHPWYVLGALAGVALVWLLVKKPFLGMFLMALLYPFIYLQLNIGEINIQYVDVIAMFLFLAWVIRLAYEKWYLHKIIVWKNVFPGALAFGLFALAGALSLVNADDLMFSVKYLFRPIIFLYLTFIVLPVNLIKTKPQFKKILNIFFWLGLALSFQGVYTMILNPFNEVIRRARPWSIFGIYPLGNNPNLLSEILISLVPAGIMLYYLTKNIKLKRVYLLGTLLMLAVCLLTFSRAAWLAVIAQGLVIWFLLPKRASKIDYKYLIIFLVVLLPLTVGMYFYFQTNFVSSSDTNRMFLEKIAWGEFFDHPLIGNGVGSFINTVGSTYYYVLDYGDPLDAHGFIQKNIAETGILGVLTFFGFLWYVIKVSYHKFKLIKIDKEKVVGATCLAIIVGNIVFQAFHPSYYFAKMWLPIGVAMAGLMIFSMNKKTT